MALRAIILIATLATQGGMRNLPTSARLGDSQLEAGMRARVSSTTGHRAMARAPWRALCRWQTDERRRNRAQKAKTNRVGSDCANLEHIRYLDLEQSRLQAPFGRISS